MDMHIDDWHETFLSKLDVDEYVDALVDAGVQAAMVKAKPHTGLCYWPCDTGRMHKGLKGWDFFGSMVEKCHANGIAVIAYFTQIFDNWAYDNHPDWRLIAPDGMTFREYRGRDHFRNGRYGIVCPNNPDYRAYVKENLQELNRKYDFEGMFLDMTFWPEICVCPHCRKRWFEETGRELPRTIDWSDPAFREFAYARSVWMAGVCQVCHRGRQGDQTQRHYRAPVFHDHIAVVPRQHGTADGSRGLFRRGITTAAICSKRLSTNTIKACRPRCRLYTTPAGAIPNLICTPPPKRKNSSCCTY